MSAPANPAVSTSDIPRESSASPQPPGHGYWRRLLRAVAMLMVAIAAHTWLIRAPQGEATPRNRADGIAEARPVPDPPPQQYTRPAAESSTPRARDVRVVVAMITVPEAVRPGPARRSGVPEFRAAEVGPRPASLRGADRTLPMATTGTPDPSDDAHAATPAPPRVPESESEAILPDAHVAPPTNTAPVAAAVINRPTAPEPAPDAMADLRTQRENVLEVLNRYARAYEKLDVRAAKAVYPSVDDRALRKAFSLLNGQNVRLAGCGVDINGADAKASCRANATYRPKVGTRAVHVNEGEWTFSLSRDEAGWQIVNMRMQ